MKIRNKLTGQVFDVVAGSLYPDFFEEVTDDEIKVGEPTIDFEIEEVKEPEIKEEPKKAKATKKKSTTKKSKRGAKKDESKRN